MKPPNQDKQEYLFREYLYRDCMWPEETQISRPLQKKFVDLYSRWYLFFFSLKAHLIVGKNLGMQIFMYPKTSIFISACMW